MESLQTLLTTVGNCIEDDPALRGGIAIGGTVAGLLALTYSWMRRGKAATKVNLTVPPG